MNLQKTPPQKNRWTVVVLALSIGVILASALILNVQQSKADTVQVGCPGPLTVRTGQDFYITVVISDALDLYAWQMDLTFNPAYLEYQYLVIGDRLTSDGANQYIQQPTSSSNKLDNIAVTRLAENSGVDGSGEVMYMIFTALAEPTSGYTQPDVEDVTLVDRNALDISKTLINSGICRVNIADDAPLLIQPPVGRLVYLPLVLK